MISGAERGSAGHAGAGRGEGGQGEGTRHNQQGVSQSKTAQLLV